MSTCSNRSFSDETVKNHAMGQRDRPTTNLCDNDDNDNVDDGGDDGDGMRVPVGRADGEDAAEAPAEPVQRRRRRGRRRPRSVSFGASHRFVVSYDNPVELKPMTVPRPKMTLEEAAMQSVTNRVANQPRLHVRRPRDEPQLVYTRGIYRPQPVYWRGTADSQGFSFLHNSSQDSRTKDLDQSNEDVDEDDYDEDSPGPGLAS